MTSVPLEALLGDDPLASSNGIQLTPFNKPDGNAKNKVEIGFYQIEDVKQ